MPQAPLGPRKAAHRLIGRIVKDGTAAGELVPGIDPYALAALLTGALEGGLMLSGLYGETSPQFETSRPDGGDHCVARV